MKGIRKNWITKVRSKINRNPDNIKGQINEIKSSSLEKINKIDNPLAGVIKWKREKTKIIPVSRERGYIIADIKMLTRKCQEQLYAQTFNNVGEVDQFF